MNSVIFGVSLVTGLVVEMFTRHTFSQKIVSLVEVFSVSFLFAIVVPQELNWGGVLLIVIPALTRLLGMRAASDLDRGLAGVIGRMYLDGHEEITVRTVAEYVRKGYRGKERKWCKRNGFSDARTPNQRD